MVDGLLIAISLVSFVDIGFCIYAEGTVRMSSVTTFLLSTLALFM